MCPTLPTHQQPIAPATAVSSLHCRVVSGDGRQTAGGQPCLGPRLAPCLETTRLRDFNPCAPLESQQYTGQGPDERTSYKLDC
uniref:Uncharacterized protein n=1 Tax=Oryza glumipatula TaxID=40148 RepID=A0A0E0BNX2_9ORYZ